MMKAVILAALLAAFPLIARAADAPAHYTLTLSADQMRVLAAALQDRPYRDVAALIAELQRQVSAQQVAPAVESPK